MQVETAVNGSGAVVPAQNVTAGGASDSVCHHTDAGTGNFVANVAATW